MSELLDLAHLDAATAHNVPLRDEVLRLFFAQSDDLLTRFGDDAAQWKMVAHTIKGSARNVGAVAAAHAAERVEAALEDRIACRSALLELRSTLAATQMAARRLT